MQALTTGPCLLAAAGTGEEEGGALDRLLQGTESVYFGNPSAQFWQGLQQGQFHPKVVKHQELVTVGCCCLAGNWQLG
jgi:hypothetical protein